MVRTVIAAAAASVAIAGSLVSVSVYTTQRDANQKAINQAVCGAVYQLDRTIVAQLQRSQQNLPKLSYYKEHPDELRRQKQDISREIRAFQPPKACGQKGATG